MRSQYRRLAFQAARAWLVVGGMVAGTLPASAQNTNDINAGIQFDFSLPGARSLAMGGAFAALADDATASYSNPAGLVIMSRLEVTTEGRGWRFLTATPVSGHVFGPPSNVGIDTTAGMVERDFSSHARRPSFISLVYPRSHWSFAVFGHQLSRFNTRRESLGPYYDCSGGYRDDTPPRPPFCEVRARTSGVDREFPKRQSIDLDIRSAGLSVAYRFSDRFSLGASFVGYRFDLDASNRVYSARDLWFQPPNWSPDNIELESTENGHDHALGGTVGALWKPRPDLSLGASYRRGPRFKFEVKTLFGPGHPCVDKKMASCQYSVQPGDVVASDSGNPFRVPDTYALGLAFNPKQTITVSVEYDRVQFSQIIGDLRDAAPPSPEESAIVLDHIKVNDGNQIRVGFEYIKLFRTRILALQAGGWYDPDHVMEFRPNDVRTGYPAPRWAVLFPPGRDEMHFTAGAGLVLSEHFQLDSGFDYSRAVRTVSFSVAYMPSRRFMH